MKADNRCQTISVTPIVRWILANQKIVNLFPRLAAEENLQKFIHQYNISQHKRNRILRSLIYIDIFLIFTLSSPQIHGVSVINFDISNLSFLSEFLLIASCLSFLILIINFISEQACSHLIQIICDSYEKNPKWNGLILKAAHAPEELAIYVLRDHINNSNPDHDLFPPIHEERISINHMVLIFLIWPFIALHAFATAWGSLYIMMEPQIGIVFDHAIAIFVLLCNLSAMFVYYCAFHRKKTFQVNS